MRTIQCPTCKGPVWTKKDLPLTMGHFSGKGHYLVIKCSRCTNSFKMHPSDFARMPEVVE